MQAHKTNGDAVIFACLHAYNMTTGAAWTSSRCPSILALRVDCLLPTEAAISLIGPALLKYVERKKV